MYILIEELKIRSKSVVGSKTFYEIRKKVNQFRNFQAEVTVFKIL